MYDDATTSLLQQLERLDPENQRELVEVGEQFGTDDVLAQLARFNEAWSSTGAIPSKYGFAADEQMAMAPLANAIQNMSDVRVGKDVARATSTNDYRDTISRGKRVDGGQKPPQDGEVCQSPFLVRAFAFRCERSLASLSR